jgi:hypothetical protein
MHIQEGTRSILPEDMDEGCVNFMVKSASQSSMAIVLAADPESPEGRSQWVWVRLPDGDLILGLYPQGDTYFATEQDHP